jgi:hypothetical protein
MTNKLKDALDTIAKPGFAKSPSPDLRQAVREYISECDNPVPDYSYRRTLRNRMRELAGCPAEPSK